MASTVRQPEGITPDLTSPLSLFLVFGFVAVGWSAEIPTGEICSRSGPPFVGSCYTLRGRMTAGADNIVVRIWPVGTKRLLGYADGALHCEFPKRVMDELAAGHQVYANIVVRPVTKSRPGVMQFVCVAAAHNIKTSK